MSQAGFGDCGDLQIAGTLVGQRLKEGGALGKQGLEGMEGTSSQGVRTGPTGHLCPMGGVMSSGTCQWDFSLILTPWWLCVSYPGPSGYPVSLPS